MWVAWIVYGDDRLENYAIRNEWEDDVVDAGDFLKIGSIIMQ